MSYKYRIDYIDGKPFFSCDGKNLSEIDVIAILIEKDRKIAELTDKLTRLGNVLHWAIHEATEAGQGEK